MGVCDTIPGISSGTIAFITGIYHRLIEAIKNFSPTLLINLIKFSVGKEKSSTIKQDIKKLDLKFLSVLFFGMFVGIMLFSRIITNLLDKQLVYTLSFFIGLILASSILIFKEIKNHKIKNRLFALIGIFFGLGISILNPINSTIPSNTYLFLGGFFGASAMFLPGISGAFILLVMGLYEFILNAIQNISQNIIPLTIFSLGLILGAVTISRVISFVFKKDKCKTLYFLIGLILGSLSVPLKEINNNLVATPSEYATVFLLFIVGILTVVLISRIEEKSKEKLIDIPK